MSLVRLSAGSYEVPRETQGSFDVQVDSGPPHAQSSQKVRPPGRSWRRLVPQRSAISDMGKGGGSWHEQEHADSGTFRGRNTPVARHAGRRLVADRHRGCLLWSRGCGSCLGVRPHPSPVTDVLIGSVHHHNASGSNQRPDEPDPYRHSPQTSGADQHGITGRVRAPVRGPARAG